MNIIWHYTLPLHLEKILKDQILKVSEAEKKFGIRPAIWFSKNQIWEPTASKMLSSGKWMSMEEQSKKFGLVRIGIEFNKNLISWGRYRYDAKINLSLYKTMQELGIEKGAKPTDWYCSFKNIASSEWVEIQEYISGNWVSILEK